MSRTVLVTGGSGYFGTLLAEQAVERGDRVRILDLEPPTHTDIEVEFVQADIRDRRAVTAACEDVDVVLHNVAQVPLAKDHEAFWSVNVVGTANLLLGAREQGVQKVVHTSSSAIFGIPDSNPVTEDTPGRPLESYGRAKLTAEVLCREAVASGLDVSIIRPRTILGHGRLGIMAILFEFVAEGAPVFVFGKGDNRYQFIHAVDLATATLLAADRPGPSTYNIGADAPPPTMRETLGALLDHAATGSEIRGLPTGPAAAAMRALAGVGMVPFAPYHWLLYGESLWFDTTKARVELDWTPTYDNAAMLIESYEWFIEHRARLDEMGGSHHQAPVPLGVLEALKRLP